MTLTDKQQAFNYLLGDLTESERDAVEERFFTDEDFSRFIDDAEIDLIDEFVRGELTETEAQMFSRNFLVSERRREKTRTAQILQNELFAEKTVVHSVSIVAEKPSFFASLAGFFRAPQIAFAVLLLIFGGWLFVKNQRAPEMAQIEEINSPSTQNIQSPTSNQSSQTNIVSKETSSDEKPSLALNKPLNANQTKTNEKLPNQPKPKPLQTQPTFASLLLLPATRSSNQNQTLNLRANVKTVNLQIVNDREEDYDRFRIEVRNIDGVLITVRDFKNTNYTRKNFNLQIASAKLASADYQVTLKGADTGADFQNLNYFYFSVENK